jgi:cytochrome oxidase Cu insertion factor (SCO1/SenC/PrrC family)
MVANRRRARILLAGTFLFFFLPVVSAWLLNVYAPDWRPFGMVNHGTLVQPVRPVSAVQLRHFAGTPLDPDYLSERWTLVHLLHGDCGQSCMDALGRSRQVHRALGDDMYRVQLLLVRAAPVDARLADLPTGVDSAVADREWLAHFTDSNSEAAEVGPDEGIYLVDPQGFLMMRYPQDVEQRALLADLKRLLKISKIG